MKEKLERLKNHVVENKKTYAAAVAGVVIGGVVVYVALKTRAGSVVISPTIEGDNNNLVVNNITQTVLTRRMHPGLVVRCNETGEVFASINRAAEVMGVPARSIRRHLHGSSPHVNGKTFEVLGEAQSA